jgi:hypothetical protein
MMTERSMEDIWRRRGGELSLDDLGLASRPFHVLVGHRISLERLLTLSRTDLLAFKNLGETSVRDIEARLADRGLSLAPDPPAWINHRRVAAAERGRALHERHQAGETFDAIGADLGLSRERIRQLVRRYRAYLARGKVP